MNADTIANALLLNNPSNAPSVINTPLNNAQVLFQYAPSTLTTGDNPGTLLPVVLSVPTQLASFGTGSGAAGSGAGGFTPGVGGGGGNNLGSFANEYGVNEEWAADGHPFIIHIVGRVSPITSGGNLRLTLHAGNGIASANPTLPGNPSNLALYTAQAALPSSNPFNANFYLEIRCLWESSSNTLNYFAQGQINGTVLAQTAGAQVNWTGPNPLQFCLGASLSGQGTGQSVVPTVTLLEFSGERV